MSERHALEETFARLRRPLARRDTKQLAQALDELGDERVSMLAHYAGLSLPELEQNFQLLPLGTRMLLESFDAIRQTDVGQHVFRVEALPFALELVKGAAAHQASEAADASTDYLSNEFDRIWSERFEVDSDEDDTEKAAEALPEEVEPIGRFKTLGTLDSLDSDSHIAEIKILGKMRNSLSQPTTVHFQLKKPITVEMGEVVDLEFAVGLVRKPGFLATLSRRKNAIQVLKESVDASPGMVFVTYSQLEHTPVISFETTGPQPNAVAQLTSLQDASID